jgi:predicted transcriptional regulator
MNETTRTNGDINAEVLLRSLEEGAKKRIITVLVEEAGNELNPSQLSKRASIDLETFYDHIDDLESNGLVIYTYIVGNGPVYEIDRQNLASSIENLE